MTMEVIILMKQPEHGPDHFLGQAVMEIWAQKSCRKCKLMMPEKIILLPMR